MFVVEIVVILKLGIIDLTTCTPVEFLDLYSIDKKI